MQPGFKSPWGRQNQPALQGGFFRVCPSVHWDEKPGVPTERSGEGARSASAPSHLPIGSQSAWGRQNQPALQGDFIF